MGMRGAQRQPAMLGCLFFALHDAALGARAAIARLGKQQNLCVQQGVKPGCCHGVAFRVSAAGL